MKEKISKQEKKAIDNKISSGLKYRNNYIYNDGEIKQLAHLIENKKANNYYFKYKKDNKSYLVKVVKVQENNNKNHYYRVNRYVIPIKTQTKTKQSSNKQSSEIIDTQQIIKAILENNKLSIEDKTKMLKEIEGL